MMIMIVFAVMTLLDPAFAQRQPDPINPTRESVNEPALLEHSPSIKGRITILDSKAALVEQPQGREWRRFHEGWMPWIGAAVPGAMILLLAVFFLIKGRIRTQPNELSGRKIARYNAFERFTHWMTATCFVILALSGLNYIFGKRLLMPIIGPEAFSALSQWSKYAHNFLAWPFIVGVLLMGAVWIGDNVPNRVDWAWLKAGGGLFTNSHPNAGRFNAGQKLVFWFAIIGGLVMAASGMTLLFPFTVTGVNGMQITQALHAIVGVLFITVMLAHIYIGTVGEEGAFEGMASGEVDLAWAEANHNLWLREQQGKEGTVSRTLKSEPAE
ncbi:formate dehydrogenase subunit gamma (plasmid) [Microvirga terrae]|uniref:Formate dehydrogenase subunit gamma n=1 Tax=Microvirga terrae TaxID=2740529 RepID=A0ABY5RY25_9HYPH|nr:formate dehydrogenase subunit gamma [Microvirga terrae]UVF22171.1 formate dehydrogenase subunit gamma [Microvirga terrae]